jgi:hypothetical protein
MNSSAHLGLLAAAWLTAAVAQAQPAAAATASAADPLQPAAAVPAMVYTSPLARYRAAGDVEVGAWREVNDTVTRIGGWRAYARQASQPEAPAPAPAAASAVPGHGQP